MDWLFVLFGDDDDDDEEEEEEEEEEEDKDVDLIMIIHTCMYYLHWTSSLI